MQNQVQSSKCTRRSTGWCNQPVGHHCSISVFKLHFLMFGILKILPQVFMQSTFAKRQIEFVVFVSYIVLLCTLYCDLLSVLQISSFYQLIESSVYLSGDILAPTDQLELLGRQSKIRFRGMTQYREKDHSVRITLSCSWCNGYVLRLLCRWFSVWLSPCRLAFFSLLFFRLC